MQALSAEQYARLQRLARLYQYDHAREIKHHPQRNPHLAVDMLCFQPLAGGEPGQELIGALMTPISLSLALVSATPMPVPEHAKNERLVALPSGRYPFDLEMLSEGEWLWRCPLLDDVSDLATLHEANRLAQHLLERVLTEPVQAEDELK